MTLAGTIESLLFWRGEPLALSEIAKLTGKSEGEVKAAVSELEEVLSERGVQVVKNADKILLTTAPGASSLIEKLTKEELSRDLGRAGLEALTIILYAGPIARPEIDWIRGVNSNFILRHLLIRGLIERLPNPSGRSYLYQPTFELLNYLGVKSVAELPEYEKARATALAALKNDSNHDQTGELN